MGLYLTQEAGFELPANWLDASINVLEYARPEGKLRVALSRTERLGQDLAASMQDRLVEQRRQLPFFELLERSDRLTANIPSVDTKVTFEESSQRVYQRSLSFVMGTRFYVLGVSASEAMRAEVDAVFERAVTTLSPRQRGGGG